MACKKFYFSNTFKLPIHLSQNNFVQLYFILRKDASDIHSFSKMQSAFIMYAAGKLIILQPSLSILKNSNITLMFLTRNITVQNSYEINVLFVYF